MRASDDFEDARATARDDLSARGDRSMAAPLRVTFVGGRSGSWRIDRIEAVRGPSLPLAGRLAILESDAEPSADAGRWAIRGVTSNERYVTRAEHDALDAIQPSLGRPEATQAALIPIRKSEDWWALPQYERRAIFEETSRHVRTGLGYLPDVARRLYHSRDLGEPFDFLTWFEFAPAHAHAFDELARRLRTTAEWDYVEREVEIRVSRP